MVLDGSGLLAIPGLINAHVHIGDSVAKDVGIGLSLRELVHPIHGLKTRVLRETREDDMYQAMAATSQDMLASGITTFADFREGGLAGVKLGIKALGKSPQRGIILGRPSYYFKEEEVANESELLPDETVNELRQTIDLSGGLGVSGPNEYTKSALKQISDLCRGKNKLLAIHAAESAETTKFSLEKFSSSEVHRALHYLKPDFMIHLTKSSEEDIAELSKNKIPTVCCPRANAILGLGFPPIAELFEAQIPVALGTDNVMLNAPDMFREMDYTSRSLRAVHHDEAVIGSREIFKMATLNGAKALGLASTLGSIEEGKNADIVLLNTNTSNLRFSKDLIGSIVHRANRADVQCVMVSGEIVHGEIPKV
jgi:cytosine/adenosine deaminase-related metal-dependent hydrolase